MNAARGLLDRVVREIGVDPLAVAEAPDPGRPIPLPSRLSVGDLAWACVTAVRLAAGLSAEHAPDPRRIAVAYRSDHALRLDGKAPRTWSSSSGFWRAADGWVRTHGNYPHHAEALQDALGLDPADEAAEFERLRAVIGGRSVHDLVASVSACGGLLVPVRPEDPPADRAWRRTPLVASSRAHLLPVLPSASPRSPGAPLAGVRVLDLTRVIAGPVCTRTLALLGADVLRIDPPHRPELPWQHLDTGHGKRSAVLDATSARMRELVAGADVVVLGYRPASLARRGLSPEMLTAEHPRLIVAQLSAWGEDAPERAGFDSLVQAESGIAMVEADGAGTPGALPAQALDHSAGYLLAAAITAAVRHRDADGGGAVVRTSLRRVAAELLGMPRRDEPGDPAPDEPGHTQEFTVGGHRLVTAAPVLRGLSFAPPRPWGADPADWEAPAAS
ncbi:MULTISPECIES: CoA transferase [unclassified Microbacterium]|uniref:CoA transferase n=1 Tax=unclassified Microbacterium TaxID=2609290 RepID=UPI0030105A8C